MRATDCWACKLDPCTFGLARMIQIEQVSMTCSDGENEKQNIPFFYNKIFGYYCTYGRFTCPFRLEQYRVMFKRS